MHTQAIRTTNKSQSLSTILVLKLAQGLFVRMPLPISKHLVPSLSRLSQISKGSISAASNSAFVLLVEHVIRRGCRLQPGARGVSPLPLRHRQLRHDGLRGRPLSVLSACKMAPVSRPGTWISRSTSLLCANNVWFTYGLECSYHNIPAARLGEVILILQDVHCEKMLRDVIDGLTLRGAF